MGSHPQISDNGHINLNGRSNLVLIYVYSSTGFLCKQGGWRDIKFQGRSLPVTENGEVMKQLFLDILLLRVRHRETSAIDWAALLPLEPLEMLRSSGWQPFHHWRHTTWNSVTLRASIASRDNMEVTLTFLFQILWSVWYRYIKSTHNTVFCSMLIQFCCKNISAWVWTVLVLKLEYSRKNWVNSICCWCPGSLHSHFISNHAIVNAG